MARWLIGDIQGCYQALTSLMEKISFNPQTDILYPLGDLINRGDDDLATLRWLYQHKDAVRPILGNHDLHLLAAYYTGNGPRKKDTFAPILEADDAPELCAWLLEQPLVRYLPEHNLLLSHAGIPPCWNATEALTYSQEVSEILTSAKNLSFFEHMYGNTPEQWSHKLEGLDRLRVITNYLTRMRFIGKNNELNLIDKGERTASTPGFMPWFDYPRNDDLNIAFGHWAALCGDSSTAFAQALDGGCVWGGELIAYNVDEGRRQSVKNPAPAFSS